MNGAAQPDRKGRGFALGLLAYALWGVLPIYFKLLGGVHAIDIVAHRILWSLPFLALLLALSRQWQDIRAALGQRRTLATLGLTAILIGGNWLLYVHAVTSAHILAASFGYYLNPLANVLLGRFVLHERLSRLQWVAVAIAGAGISVLAAGALGQLWISLTLCVSFALYGLLRKVVAADAVVGLSIETGLLLLIAIAWLAWRGSSGAPVFGPDGGFNLNGGRPIPPDLVIEWKNILPVDPGFPARKPRKIDTRLSLPLTALPSSVVPPPDPTIHLAVRNSMRGKHVGLASGQQVARAMRAPVLTNATLGLSNDPGWAGEAPLWYYILKEAELPPNNVERLGAVGGRIVAEVLVGVLQRDPNSYLYLDPAWKPAPPIAPAIGQFTFVDLLRFAGAA